MPETDIGSTVASDLNGSMVEYSVGAEVTDASQGVGEYRYQLHAWDQYLGYYKKIPELQAAIDTKTVWVLGGGFEADEQTSLLLSMLKGSGKDSFNSLLSNMYRVMTLAGDAYAEIIRDEEDILINLKPLDPSSMVIVYDKLGRIKRYEQVTKHTKTNKRFSPEEIFHLSRNRLADEVHGQSIIPSVEWIILARNEAMTDWKKVLHRNVSPLQIHYIDSDDETQIAAYKTKADAARAGGENMYVPKGTVEVEVVQSQLNQAASPAQWIRDLNGYFFQAVQLPQIIVGNSQEFTDASAKIAYLAFEQNLKGEQLYIEEQVLDQLNYEIELNVAASLQNDVISGDTKNGPLDQAAQPNDTTAELEGNT